MKRKITGLLSAAGMLMLFCAGCAMNEIKHVDQPESAAPGSSVDVYVVDIYYIDPQGPTFSQPWVRDSLLIAPVLPAGWSVNTAEYYIDTNAYKTYTTYMTPGDTNGFLNLDIPHIMDSVSGGIVRPTATGAFDNGIIVNYSIYAATPHAYLGLHPINIPAGTAVDTAITDTSGTQYVKIIGCYIHYNLTAPMQENTYQLGYVVGFQPNALLAETTVSLENSYAGDNAITITPVRVFSAAAVRPIALNATIAPHPVTPRSRLSCALPPELADTRADFTLFDAAGVPCAWMTGTTQSGWNYFDLSGLLSRAGTAGTYVIRMELQGQSVQQRVLLLK